MLKKDKLKLLGVLLISLLAVAGCNGESVEQTDNYDELAPYYTGEKVAEYPEEMLGYRDTVENNALPFVKVTGQVGRTSTLDSKLLGNPYLPKGFEYPRDPEGRPLRLLAQINFADVPPLAGYPDDGILQFYISDELDTDNQAWGLQFHRNRTYDARAQFELMQSQEYFRVIWHGAVDEESQGLSDYDIRYDSQSFMPVEAEARLTFESGISYPDPVDYRFAKIFGKDEFEFFDQFGDKAESVAVRYMSHIAVEDLAWIGGYASFTQGDPREIERDEEWLLLFELQSSMSPDQPPVMWGDVGVGAFFIRPGDLRDRNFTKVLYTWDSH